MNWKNCGVKRFQAPKKNKLSAVQAKAVSLQAVFCCAIVVGIHKGILCLYGQKSST